MSAESAAFSYVLDFRWRQGDPSISEAEARLHDLRALQAAITEVVEITVGDARADDLTWTQIGDALASALRLPWLDTAGTVISDERHSPSPHPIDGSRVRRGPGDERQMARIRYSNARGAKACR